MKRLIVRMVCGYRLKAELAERTILAANQVGCLS